MKPIIRITLAAVVLSSFSLLPSSFAQVPGMINYQGRVTVAGTNFTGTGLFQFALVDGTGATTYWSNGVNVVSNTVTKGLYSVLLGDTTIPNMDTAIPATVFTNSDVRLRVWVNDGLNGQQQLSPDQRIVAVGYAMMAANVPDGFITSNKIANGAVTSAKIAAGAVGTSQLASGAVGAAQLAAGAVTSNSIAAGSIASSQLASGAAAANLLASGQSGVASGGMVLSYDANSTSLMNAGYVKIGTVSTAAEKWRQLASGNPPSPRSGHVAVWTGNEMVIFGGSAGDAARYSPATNVWTPISTNGAPTNLGTSYCRAYWTGTEMLVWDPSVSPSGKGGRYNPTANTWTSINTNGAPTASSSRTAVWTGSELIVWGRYWNMGPDVYDGARYNLGTDSWTAINTNGAPTGGGPEMAAAWTGSEMILWSGNYTNSNGRYNPVSNSWSPVSTNNVPGGLPGSNVRAIWTGNEMILWGLSGPNYGARYNPTSDSWSSVSTNGAPSSGYGPIVWTGTNMLVAVSNGSSPYYWTMGRYNPGSNLWLPISTSGAPQARSGHSAIWTGSEMILWGGTTGMPSYYVLNDGGRYSPTSDTWTLMSTNNPAPSARYDHLAVWTGAEMLIWGGTTSYSGSANDSFKYTPAVNNWTAMSSSNAPSWYSGMKAVWTGSEMIIAGALRGYSPSSDTWRSLPYFPGAPGQAVWTGTELITWDGWMGSRFNPTTGTSTSISSSNAPSGRENATAIWSGSEMIIWGGSTCCTTYFNDGKRYNPSTDSWTSMSTSNSPSARSKHAAFWTGSEMIVWGGVGASYGSPQYDGGRYNPVSNSWSPIATSGAPTNRTDQSAIWSGSDMIVWGGQYGYMYNYLNDGARYSPALNAWTPLIISNAPPGRARHSAVWADTEMLIFGGRGLLGQYSEQAFDTLWGYTPPTSLFLYKKP